MPEFILILGSNLGNKEENLARATSLISEKFRVTQKAGPVITPAYHFTNQGEFMNSALLIHSDIDPLSLLRELQNIEKQVGQKSRFKNGPREIDIDIAWWSGGRFSSTELDIPHPANRSRYWVRQFISKLKNDSLDILTGIRYSSMPETALHSPADFISRKKKKEKITILTCYDYTMANILARTSIDAVMVGDSLGNVIQGHPSTVPVDLNDILYHSRAVRRAAEDLFIISDLPFMSYQVSAKQALKSAGRLVKEANCSAVKLEGAYVKAVQKITEAGIPVMGHLGLTPQSVKAFGGYRVQAKSQEAQKRLVEDALKLQDSGCFSIVLEMVPELAAQKVAEALEIPVIGIGAGALVDGQVLVVQDMLGMNPDFSPRFVRKYNDLFKEIADSIEKYCHDVRAGEFPGEKEKF